MDTSASSEKSAPAFVAIEASLTNETVRHLIALALVLGMSILLMWHSFAAMVHTWSSDRSYSHEYLVPIVALYLAWSRREALSQAPFRPFLKGLPLLALLVSLWVAADIGSVLVVEEFTAIAILVTMGWIVAGSALARRFAFPLGFLFFAVPFGKSVVPALQDLTAAFATSALQLSTVPVVLENHFISVPGSTWHVAEACSGLRFLNASIVLGVAFAGVVYRRWARRIVFVALSVIVPIIANGIRAYGIVLLGYLSNKRLAAGVDHVVYGWLFFTVVSFCLISFGMRMREKEQAIISTREEVRNRSEALETHTPVKSTVWVGLAALMIVALGSLGANHLWGVSVPKSSIQVSASGKWRETPTTDTGWAPMIGSINSTIKNYERPGGQSVQVYLGNYPEAKYGVEVVSSYNAVADSSLWMLTDDRSRLVALRDRQITVRQLTLRSNSAVRLVWLWYIVGEQAVASVRELKLQQTKYRLMLQPQPVSVVAVSASDVFETRSAAAVLKNFLSDVSFIRRFDSGSNQ
ncbi:MAG: exosortase A [Candidatus Korobacteraceae bacterium]